jgi:hypothetical protein
MCCLEPPFCTSNMLALATKITQADYDHERLVRNSYSDLISHVVKSCLIIEPSKRPDVIGVAALIAEKILTFTDLIRNKSINLEKKLEKEKNKTQKLFCNKQDLATPSYQMNYNNSTNSFKGCDVNGEPVVGGGGSSGTQQMSTNVSPATSSKVTATAAATKSVKVTSELIKQAEQGKPGRSTSYRSTSLSLAFNKENEPTVAAGQEREEQQQQQQQQANAGVQATGVDAAKQPSTPVSPSPNAKLPPIRNPKTKLIMKNLQNKQQKQLEQQQQQQQQQQSIEQMNSIQNQLIAASKASNGSLNQDSPPTSQTAGANQSSQPDLKQAAASAKVNSAENASLNNKIQRSSSSSVLEKRSSQSKKSRPNSANSPVLPVYKKLRPIEDPIIQILEQIHKLLFISHVGCFFWC